MKTTVLAKYAILLLASSFVIGCSETTTESSTDLAAGDKPGDVSADDDGKTDAWNRRNDPNRFGGDHNYTLTELPLEGRIAREAWASSYFPTYNDSVNDRWNSELSPAEKYDRAFNGWTPPEGFDDLRPFQPRNCEEDHWDPEYYDALGPLATLVSGEMGNREARDGEDSDNDGQIDECDDMDGVSTWWGLCHAWAPAAILEDRPLSSVTHNGVTFHTGDLEALLILAYNRNYATMIGDRCNLFNTPEELSAAYGCRLPEVEATEEDGRPECTEYQLENYVVTRDESGRAEQDQCRDTNAGSFHVIMTNYIGLMQEGFVYDRTWDSEVWNQPVVAFEVSSLEEITVEQANELVGETGDVYTHNEKADTLYEVSAQLTYITESHTADVPAEQARYERNDYYTYILEVDSEGLIIGGEWTGTSRRAHPDFLWSPEQRRTSSVAHLDLENVRMLIQISREPAVAEGETLTFGSDSLDIAIPDNDELGVSTDIVVDRTMTVGTLDLELNVAHTYIGDLTVTLTAPDGTSRVLHNREGGGDDSIERTIPVQGFDGLAARGTWTLHVADHANLDHGAIKLARLLISETSEAPAVDPATEGLSAATDTSIAIPDNDPDGGAVATLTLSSEAVVGTVALDIDIQHTYVGDLLVVLSHGDREHVVHEHTGGGRDNIVMTYNIDAFAGMTAAGDWTLRVADHAEVDEGTIEAVTLTVTPESEVSELEPETTVPESFPGEGELEIPDNAEAGITSVAYVPENAEGVVSVALNLTHTWRGDLKVVLAHGEQSWVLHDRTGLSADDIVDSFVLDPAPTAAAGEYNLTVSDHAPNDEGTLNSWSVRVTP